MNPRRAAGLAAALLLCAAPAAPAAAPVALTLTGEDNEESLAVAGDGVLVSRTRGRDLRVDRFPVAGGPAATVLSFRAPAGAEASGARLAASSTTAAAVMTTSDAESELRALQAFAGPAAGPLMPIEPLREFRGEEYFATFVDVDEDRLVRQEFRGDFRGHRRLVVAPGGEPAEVRLRRSVFVADVAGDLVAYADPTRREMKLGDEPKRLVVADWRSGERRWTRSIPGAVETVDLHADGRVLVGEDGGGVVEVAAGGAGIRRIARRGTYPAYAGDAVVFLDAAGTRVARLYVAGSDRRPRRFGVPSALIDTFDAGERHVAWLARGCVLAAPIDAGAAPAPAPGPCPRSEVEVIDRAIPTLRRNRRVPLVVHCIAAPAGGCRGAIRLHLDSGAVSPRRRFRVPLGARRRIVLRVTRRGAAAIRRDAVGFGQSVLWARGSLVDPDGRRSEIKGHTNVVVRR